MKSIILISLFPMLFFGQPKQVQNVHELHSLKGTDGDFVYLMGYNTINDGGQGFFFYDSKMFQRHENGGTIIGPTPVWKQVENYAKEATSTSSKYGYGCWVRQLERPIPVNPKWWGIDYNVYPISDLEDDWVALQAAINYNNSLSSNGLSGGAVFVDGFVRIRQPLKSASRTVFQGINNVRSRIIYTGGNKYDHVIDFGYATWGGIEDIRVQGYDHLAETPTDKPDYLLKYSHVDLEHISDNVFFQGSKKAAVLFAGPSGRAGFTNAVFNKTFFSYDSGYAVEIVANSGNERLLQFNGITCATPWDNEYEDIHGFVKSNTRINAVVNGARFEYNSNTTHDDFSLFYLTNQAAGVLTYIQLIGLTSYVRNISYPYAVVNAPKKDQVSLTIIGGAYNGAKAFEYRDGTVSLEMLHNGMSYFGLGANSSRIGIGDKTILNFPSSQRYKQNQFQRVKDGDLNIADGSVDIYRVADGKTATPSANGWQAITNVIEVNIGDTVLKTDRYWKGVSVGLLIRIHGAGIKGTDMITTITKIDNRKKEITIADKIKNYKGRTHITVVGV